MMGVFNLISALALFFENTNKILILNTKKDNFEKTENYDHANKVHKYIVVMACNANIASTETNLQ